MSAISGLPPIGPSEPELGQRSGAGRAAGPAFSATLREAIESVDELQRQSETAQVALARGDDVDLHDVLIKVEEAEVAFKTMMEIRNKLVDAYREIMRMGA